MSKSIDFGSEITGKIKDAIKAKLAELGSYIDEELPDYIMIMIANRKSKAQMVEDLQLFLGTNTDSFVTWLQDMLQQLELLSSSTKAVSHKKAEKQASIEKDRRRSSESLSIKPKADSDENSNSRNADSSFRQDLDIKGGEDDFGIEKSDEAESSATAKLEAHHHHHHHHESISKEKPAGLKRRASSPVFEEDKPSPTKQPALTTRRRAVEQVPSDGARKKETREVSPVVIRHRARSRSKSPRRSRGDSRSRSRSPRGHYSKRVVASVLASRQREHEGRSRGDAVPRNSGRNRRVARDSGIHDRRSRDTPSDTDENERESAGAVSSSVRIAQRRSAVPAPLQPTTSLLMRAIAEAKHSIEGVPQSEIKVPPNSALADKGKEEESDGEDSDVSPEKQVVVENKRRKGSERVKSLHVISTSDGGFLSRSKQAQLKKQEDRQKQIMSKLLLRQIEAEEAELAEKEAEEETKEDEVTERIEKKKKDDAEVRAFNKTAVKDSSTKTLYPSDNNVSSSSTSADALMKALFRDGTSDNISIPLAPNKNNPQFIVTLEGVDESLIMKAQPKPKLSMSQRLEPRSSQSLQSRLGPPISDSFASSVDMDHDDESNVIDSKPVPPVSLPLNVPSSSDGDSSLSPMKTNAPPQRPAERCRFWPNCKAGDSCTFVHPSQPCKAFPNCRFGARCLFIHPNCKFDAACLNPECPYTHGNGPIPATAPTTTSAPAAATTAQTTASTPATAAANSAAGPTAPSGVTVAAPVGTVPLCKFFPNCSNPFCLFSHPKPCRFGPNCYYKKTCTFWHPSAAATGLSANPAMSKLRWSAATAATTTANNTTTSAPPANVEPPSATAVN